MVPPADDEHDCGWKAYAKHQQTKLEELSEQLATVKAKLDELALRSKGHRSERRKSKKMPPPVAPKADPEDTKKKRKDADELRNTKLETELVPVPVPPDACRCPECGNEKLRNVGNGKPSTVYEYVPGYLRRRIYRACQEFCVC